MHCLRSIAFILEALAAGNTTVDSLGLADNIKVITWAPQNDVLGHPAVKAFVTQAGINSLYEAAYHAVPIVAVPLIADQDENAAKVIPDAQPQKLVGFNLGQQLQTQVYRARWHKALAAVLIISRGCQHWHSEGIWATSSPDALLLLLCSFADSHPASPCAFIRSREGVPVSKLASQALAYCATPL